MANVKEAFERLYERSPIPRILQTHQPLPNSRSSTSFISPLAQVSSSNLNQSYNSIFKSPQIPHLEGFRSKVLCEEALSSTVRRTGNFSDRNNSRDLPLSPIVSNKDDSFTGSKGSIQMMSPLKIFNRMKHAGEISQHNTSITNSAQKKFRNIVASRIETLDTSGEEDNNDSHTTGQQTYFNENNEQRENSISMDCAGSENEDTIIENNALNATNSKPFAEDVNMSADSQDTVTYDEMEYTCTDNTGSVTDITSKNVKDTSSGKVYTLYEWIIKPVPQYHGICVEGKRSNSQVEDEFWHSSVIEKRIDRSTVRSVSGSIYKLVGKVDEEYTLEAGFSKKVVKAFKHGFPPHWIEIIDGHFKEDESILVEKQKGALKVVNQENENWSSPTSETFHKNTVCTPVGHFVQIDSLKKTRSGRIVKPPLAAWAGQRLVTDSNSNTVKIEHNTEFAQKVLSEMAEEYKYVPVRYLSSVSRILVSEFNKSKQISGDKPSSAGKKRSSAGIYGLTPKSSDEENLNPEKSISKILKKSKQERFSQAKQGKRTCYSKFDSKIQENSNDSSFTESRDQYSIDGSETDCSESDKKVNLTKKQRSSNARTSNKTQKKSVKSKNNSKVATEQQIVDKMQTRHRAVRKDGIETNNRSRSRSNGRRNTGKSKNQDKDSQSNSQSKKSNETEVTDRVSRPWSRAEVKRLKQAVLDVKPDDADFWSLVTAQVKTRSQEECMEYYYGDETEVKKPQRNTKKSTTKGPVSLTAKRGTMKRKQQLRDIMDQYNEGYEDDLFDSTPFRKKGQNKSAKMDKEEMEVDVFEHFGKKRSHLLNRIHTPVTRIHIEPVSERRTPAATSTTPWRNIDRKEADQYINKLKKDRLGKHSKDVSRTPHLRQKKESLPMPSKNLFSKKAGESIGHLLVDEHSSSDDHADSADENDYYWSDADTA